LLLYTWCSAHPVLHPFPTRRSSDLITANAATEFTTLLSEFKHSSYSFECKVASTAAGNGHIGIVAAFVRVDGDNHYIVASRNFRSEEHTSELQSRENLVCRLLLEKK